MWVFFPVVLGVVGVFGITTYQLFHPPDEWWPTLTLWALVAFAAFGVYAFSIGRRGTLAVTFACAMGTAIGMIYFRHEHDQ